VIGTSGSTSGDGKRRVAAWPKRPRPSSTLPNATYGPRRPMSAVGGQADSTRIVAFGPFRPKAEVDLPNCRDAQHCRFRGGVPTRDSGPIMRRDIATRLARQAGLLSGLERAEAGWVSPAAVDHAKHQRGKPASTNESNICFRKFGSRHNSFRIR
jgi:hypothetical protein